MKDYWETIDWHIPKIWDKLYYVSYMFTTISEWQYLWANRCKHIKTYNKSWQGEPQDICEWYDDCYYSKEESLKDLHKYLLKEKQEYEHKKSYCNTYEKALKLCKLWWVS